MAIIGQSALVAAVYLSAFCILGLRSVDRARYAGSVKQMATSLMRPRVALP